MYSDYSFIFDVDGTLCPIKKPDEEYADLVPIPDMVEKLKFYHEHGAHIVLFTSRNMRTYNGDLTLIEKNTRPIMEAWLKKWDIPYDELIMGKPWPGHKGFYVDDRSVRPDEFINKSIDELEEMVKKSRES